MTKDISYYNYCQSVKNIFSFLKHSKNHQDLFLKAIEIENNNGYFLVPISNLHLNDHSLINKLTK